MIRNSRSQFIELLESLSNLACAELHALDWIIAGDDNVTIEQQLELVQSIRLARGAVQEQLAPEFNEKVHCVVKHLLIASEDNKQYIATLTDPDQVNKVAEVQDSINSALTKALAFYLKLPYSELENKDCIRCLDDFINSKKANEN